MKKWFRKSSVILSLAALAVIGCSQSTEQAGSSNSASGGTDGTVKLSVAHIFPENHPGGIHLKKFAEEVSAKTNGAVEITVHHAGVLGSEADEIQQIQAGNLDMALLYGISNFQNIDPQLGVEELPFVFKDKEHAHRALDGAFGKAVSEKLASKGFQALSYWENGFRHFTNNKIPITTPEDMNGVKFRSAEIPIRLEMFKQLNASAIPMAFTELFTALQQGTVDGQENPLSIIETNKFYEVQKYLSLSGHIYNSAVLVTSPQSMEKLSPEQQKIVAEVAEKIKAEEREMVKKQDEELVAVLKEKGMEVNEIDREAFVKAVQPVWNGFTSKNGDELLKLIQEAEKQ
ncbi:DctP family TRAP transporter solute-binding subunit [Brevibacillus massiliensis]|jgi:tripartite ATP-independent transporter DctP family solute receptor|uniref:TRAP transporter substrate-binding protein n=1 Tax=Brevibacillus massiliensis TaxID=1118054 RepID=UPI000362BB2D|nr:DctP family TRAP transporter solute-binding subunit [Brevibacillus massiliensis]